MDGKTLIGVILLVALLAAGYVAGTQSSSAAQAKTQTSIANQQDANSAVKEFTMVAKQFEFVPSTITVKKGDLVRITITSVDVAHGIALPAFGINEILEPNKPVAIEFVADKAGEFTSYCSVWCEPGHERMKGKIIVTE